MLDADPPPRPPGATGRPRRHGVKFNCADPTTWPTPTATLVCTDAQYGTVTVAAWSGLVYYGLRDGQVRCLAPAPREAM